MNSKQLIAVAAMALSGAAMAQSSVTVYGRLDASIGSVKEGNIGEAIGVTKLFANNMTTSRIGFKGTEDLGGGLSALFILESSFSPDAPGTTFLGDRAAVVGLSGGFGTIKLGRHDTSFDDIRDLMVSSNLWDSGSLATTETIVSTGANATNGVGKLVDYGDRANNQIRYESPNFGGVTFGFSKGLDETAHANNDITAYNIRFRTGNLDIGAAHQSNAMTPPNADNTKNYVLTKDIAFNTVAGAYNFGTFRVSGGWNQAKQKNVASPIKSNTYTVGINVPVNAFDFSLGYSSAKAKQNGGTLEKGSAYSLGSTYALSNRTKLYAALTNGDIKDGAGKKLRQRDIYAVGMRHEF